MNYGLYFHIPFCMKKCRYCDFLSFTSFDYSLRDKKAYFRALLDEWYVKSNMITEDDVIDSIYFGGGTPSFVEPGYIQTILKLITDDKIVSEDAEITIEVNPGTITAEKLECYREYGVNRISIGIQSTQNRLLKSLGRIHDAAECEEAVKLAVAAGFRNINCDLIFGIPQVEDEPGQTYEEFVEDLNNVLNWGARHISAYSLIIEEGTPMCKLFEEKKAFEISTEVERQMYHDIPKFIKEHSMRMYEISNFSRIGCESRHNLKYWKCLPYIGFGLGAASYYPVDSTDKNSDYIRETNTRKFIDYNNKYYLGEKEIIDKEEQMKEFMMLGFRCVSGPNKNTFKSRFGCDYADVFKEQLERLSEKGLIVFNRAAKLTKKGYDFANEVFREFV